MFGLFLIQQIGHTYDFWQMTYVEVVVLAILQHFFEDKFPLIVN